MTRKKKEPACAYCGQPATLLCDFVFGFEIAGWTKCDGNAAYNANRLEEYVSGKGLPYSSLNSEMYTCDAPICKACSRCEGTVFVCGDKKHSRAETVDICFHHEGRELSASRPMCITAEQAERLRVQTWKTGSVVPSTQLSLFGDQP
jgi:hypothetical protein